MNPFSFVVLALVGEGGAGPHDIVDMMRRGASLYWAAAPSQIYAEPKRLEKLGYLSSRKEPGKTRPRTVYSLTPAGRKALVDWLGEPASFPRIQNEAVLKVLAGDLADEETVVRSLEGLQAEATGLAALVEENERRAAALPHRERYLRLVHSLGARLIAAHVDWLAEVRRELGESSRVERDRR